MSLYNNTPEVPIFYRLDANNTVVSGDITKMSLQYEDLVQRGLMKPVLQLARLVVGSTASRPKIRVQSLVTKSSAAVVRAFQVSDASVDMIDATLDVFKTLPAPTELTTGSYDDNVRNIHMQSLKSVSKHVEVRDMLFKLKSMDDAQWTYGQDAVLDPILAGVGMTICQLDKAWDAVCISEEASRTADWDAFLADPQGYLNFEL